MTKLFWTNFMCTVKSQDLSINTGGTDRYLYCSRNYICAQLRLRLYSSELDLCHPHSERERVQLARLPLTVAQCRVRIRMHCSQLFFCLCHGSIFNCRSSGVRAAALTSFGASSVYACNSYLFDLHEAFQLENTGK